MDAAGDGDVSFFKTKTNLLPRDKNRMPRGVEASRKSDDQGIGSQGITSGLIRCGLRNRNTRNQGSDQWTGDSREARGFASVAKSTLPALIPTPQGISRMSSRSPEGVALRSCAPLSSPARSDNYSRKVFFRRVAVRRFTLIRNVCVFGASRGRLREHYTMIEPSFFSAYNRKKYIATVDLKDRPIATRLCVLLEDAFDVKVIQLYRGFPVVVRDMEWSAGFAMRAKCPMVYCHSPVILKQMGAKLKPLMAGQSCIELRAKGGVTLEAAFELVGRMFRLAATQPGMMCQGDYAKREKLRAKAKVEAELAEGTKKTSTKPVAKRVAKKVARKIAKTRSAR